LEIEKKNKLLVKAMLEERENLNRKEKKSEKPEVKKVNI
jgi:hypothetical protein